MIGLHQMVAYIYALCLVYLGTQSTTFGKIYLHEIHSFIFYIFLFAPNLQYSTSGLLINGVFLVNILILNAFTVLQLTAKSCPLLLTNERETLRLVSGQFPLLLIE